MQEQSKVLKVKAKQKSSMCSPRALEMPLYKECKKLIISSSSPYHHHFMLLIPSSLPAKFPPLPSLPWVGMTMQKGTERMQLFAKP
jgi:hypothetical protein